MSLQWADPEAIYAKDKKLKREDVNAIFDWLKKQPHAPEVTELQVILFLHSCHYRIEATKVCMENYGSIQNLCPVIFDCEPQEALKQAMSMVAVTALPEKTPEGYIVLTMKLIDPDPTNFNYVYLIKMDMMVMTLYLHQYGPAAGFVILGDMKGSTLGHLSGINLSVLKYALLFLQEAAPIRLKAVHLTNISTMTSVMLNMFKPFVKSTYFNMIHLHSGSYEGLHKSIPKEYLPSDFGGVLPATKELFEKTKEDIFNNWSFFKWWNTQRADDSKRIEPVKDVNKIFGMEGTFKKLEID